MPQAQVVLDQPGPLPITKTFQYNAQGPGMVYVSGTAWTAQPAPMVIGLEVFIDGKSIATLQVMTNESESHKTLISAFFPIDLDYGSHEMLVYVFGASTVTDQNDMFNVSILYY